MIDWLPSSQEKIRASAAVTTGLSQAEKVKPLLKLSDGERLITSLSLLPLNAAPLPMAAGIPSLPLNSAAWLA